VITVYGRPTSANVQKVLWCCDEIGLAVKQVPVGGPYGGTSEPQYLAMNPNARVPTLVLDGFVLWESNTILRFLARQFPEAGMLAQRLETAAIGEQWMDWQLSMLSPAFAPLYIKLIREPAESRRADEIELLRRALADKFRLLDAHLDANEFVAGNTFGVADITLGVFAWRWLALPIQREAMPGIERWHARLLEREGFRRRVVEIGLS